MMKKPDNSELADDMWEALSDEEKEKHMDVCSKKVKKDEAESVLRFDVLPLETKFDSTPDGFLQGSAIVTRTGVFTYVNMDGSLRYELRTPEEVFRADSIETLKMKPVTEGHPKTLISAEDAGKYQVGSTGSLPRMDGSSLAIDLVITQAKTIKAIKAGKREISCGYRCDTIPESGIWNGIPYTHIQKNIVYNHAAIVTKGRAGSVARIRLDGALAPLEIDNAKENDGMDTINLDNAEYQADAKVIETLKQHKADAEDTKVKLDTAISDKSKVEAERDSFKEKLDSVEKELADLKKVHVDSADVSKLVRQRVELETTATAIGADFKTDEDDLAIMKAVIMLQSEGKAKLDGKDEVYIKARYDAAVEDHVASKEKKDDATSRVVNTIKADGVDQKPVSYAESRKKYVEAQKTGYKTKV
jgi:hypothetical protein